MGLGLTTSRSRVTCSALFWLLRQEEPQAAESPRTPWKRQCGNSCAGTSTSAGSCCRRWSCRSAWRTLALGRTRASRAPSGCSPLPTPSSVCVLGHQQHCDKAKAVDVPHMDIEVLKKLIKSKKLVKKLAKKDDAFLASEFLIMQIPRVLGQARIRLGSSLARWPTMRIWWPKWMK